MRRERAEAAIEPRERAGGERQHRDLPELDPEVEAEQREGDGNHARARSRTSRFSTHVATIVKGMRNSIRAVGSTTAPVTASASVAEWPMVNALITQRLLRQSRPR